MGDVRFLAHAAVRRAARARLDEHRRPREAPQPIEGDTVEQQSTQEIGR